MKWRRSGMRNRWFYVRVTRKSHLFRQWQGLILLNLLTRHWAGVSTGANENQRDKMTVAAKWKPYPECQSLLGIPYWQLHHYQRRFLSVICNIGCASITCNRHILWSTPGFDTRDFVTFTSTLQPPTNRWLSCNSIVLSAWNAPTNIIGSVLLQFSTQLVHRCFQN